jgi:hypothetical protein
MDEKGQVRAIESLRDWSKWLIGLNLAAASGCVLVLQTANVRAAVTPFLVIAIALFALSIFCSVFLVQQLARVAEILPLRDSDGNPTTVFNRKVAAGLSVGAIAVVQLVFLGSASFFFILWVIMKAISA